MESYKTYSKHIIVFTGAGASAALNLPTTPEFAKQLEGPSPDVSSLLAVYRQSVSQTNGMNEEEVPMNRHYQGGKDAISRCGE